MANLFMLEGSEPAMSADSDLFSIPASLTDRYKFTDEKLPPVSSMSEESPAAGELAFLIPPSAEGLLALPYLGFEFDMSIKRKKPSEAVWSRITNADNVAPVNLIAHSIFQSCQVSLCNRVVSDISHYPYRAVLEVLTTFTPDAAAKQLTSSGFYMDTAGFMNDSAENKGEIARKKLFTDNEWVELSAKVKSV
jgi:hypothetical protein